MVCEVTLETNVDHCKVVHALGWLSRFWQLNPSKGSATGIPNMPSCTRKTQRSLALLALNGKLTSARVHIEGKTRRRMQRCGRQDKLSS